MIWLLHVNYLTVMKLKKIISDLLNVTLVSLNLTVSMNLIPKNVEDVLVPLIVLVLLKPPLFSMLNLMEMKTILLIQKI